MFLVVVALNQGQAKGLGQRQTQAGLAAARHAHDHHSPASRAKMSEGIALTDADREGWLTTLGQLLQAHPQGAVLTCSALKKAYRDRLRTACPPLRFAFLEIGRAEAEVRVKARAQTHFFSAALVESQFATLESPAGEPGVLTLDAVLPLSTLAQQTCAWLALQEVA